jgi:vesicle coat complex subunit
MTEKKGGELAELKTQLRALAASQQKESVQIKRELFKKIILYMTINIDVSSLFGEMIMATVTTDIAIKKMLYHYITYHAHVHPELALLSINTLLKDCRDEAPLIRGLALRNLCSLRVPNLIEYLVSCLAISGGF